MKNSGKTMVSVGGLLLLTAFSQTALAQTNSILTSVAPDPAAAPDTRYGLFNLLDHRSSYGQGVFPEPFIADDSDLEVNEIRLDWLHTTAADMQNDLVTAEIEKGFGPLTLEVEFHYERDASSTDFAQGIANIDLGARCPVYQYVTPSGSFDATFGIAGEVGVPVHTAVSKNAELVPKVFADFKLGDHVTVEMIYGYSAVLGPQDEGGTRTFEYAFDFGYTFPHSELPIPGVRQLIPVFEINGETALNKGVSGQNALLGVAAIRADLTPIKGVQPRLGVGFVFPMDNNARADVHAGIITSLVFEY